MENVRKAEEARKEIVGSFLEIAAQMEWLAIHKPLLFASAPPGDWDTLACQCVQVEWARQCYLNGAFELALEALPEF